MLIGVDGSSESTAALDAALRLFSAAIDDVTIAIALDYDGDLSDVASSELKRADDVLRTNEAISAALGYEPSTTTLVGRPAAALVAYAQSSACDLIVVGPKGHGASHLLFGSVASRLAKNGRVPVAILPGLPVEPNTQ
jgi:nucleotide-binding universal stress UspA family protein